MTAKTDNHFIGNGAYCYANGLAMLLAGADARREEMIYFSLVPPDRGVSLALEALGVAVEEKASEAPGRAPFAAVRAALAAGPLLLGPLDMGKLSHLPNHGQLRGCDHFVLLTGLSETEARLHDPLGYPNIALPLEDLATAWAAEDIAYARGAYRYWAHPRPGPRPEAAAAHIEETRAEGLLGQLIDFGLPLGARRAHDLAAFLRPGYGELAAVKARQAIVFIDAFSQAVAGDRKGLGDSLRTIGRLDEDFREGLFRI